MASLIAPLLWLGLILTGIVGWIMNVVAVFHMNFDTINGEMVLRLIGIFVAPLGSIMGLFF